MVHPSGAMPVRLTNERPLSHSGDAHAACSNFPMWNFVPWICIRHWLPVCRQSQVVGRSFDPTTRAYKTVPNRDTTWLWSHANPPWPFPTDSVEIWGDQRRMRNSPWLYELKSLLLPHAVQNRRSACTSVAAHKYHFMPLSL